MKSILDPTFRYTPAVATNIRETFRRVRREQRERKQVAELIEQANREGNALVASVLDFPNKTEK